MDDSDPATAGNATDDDGAHAAQGEVPEGVVGPEIFREQLRRAAGLDPEDGAHVTLDEQSIYLADIESVEPEDEHGHRSIITLRNGAIIAGVTGAAIVAALATIRFRRRHGGAQSE
ncbi:MAG TPA: hypothetical protein VH986_12105 [Acidimicrobiia bacterium]|jgi:hypothetical protein